MYIKSDVTYQIHVKTKKKCAIAQLCRLIIAGSSVVSVWARGGQKRWRCCQLPTHCYFLLSYELKIQKPGLAVRQASIARRGNCSRLPSPKRRPWISQVPVMRLCVAAAWSSLAHTKFMTSCLFTVFVYRAVEHTDYRLCLPCCWTSSSCYSPARFVMKWYSYKPSLYCDTTLRIIRRLSWFDRST